jgi:hypothetical protein
VVALKRARAHGASTVCGHIYLAQSTPVLVVVRARRTPQCPSRPRTAPRLRARLTPRFFHAAAARAGARRFNRVRAHIPGTEHASPGGRPRAPHAAVPLGLRTQEVPSAGLHLCAL